MGGNGPLWLSIDMIDDNLFGLACRIEYLLVVFLSEIVR